MYTGCYSLIDFFETLCSFLIPPPLPLLPPLSPILLIWLYPHFRFVVPFTLLCLYTFYQLFIQVIHHGYISFPVQFIVFPGVNYCLSFFLICLDLYLPIRFFIYAVTAVVSILFVIFSILLSGKNISSICHPYPSPAQGPFPSSHPELPNFLLQSGLITQKLLGTSF